MQKRYPFPFLDAYERDDRDFFFGRDEEIETLYQLTQQSNIILLYGYSGTGKTSLIRCGLSNKYKSYDWQDVYIRRGGHLIRSLDRELCEEADRRYDPAASDGKAIAMLPQKLEAVYKTTFKPLYLIFDQFEELYTLGSKAEEQAFIATVREILRVEQPVKIILSIREEYLGHLYEFERQVPELLRKKLRVEPMFSDRVQQVILGVGQHPESNVRLQAGEEAAVAARIFEKLRGQDKALSIQLPYLQVLLDKYYLHCTGDERRQAEATFTLATLDTLGDLGDVLRNFLDEQVQHIARQLAQPVETLWQLLSPFVTLDGTKEPLSEAELHSRLPEGLPAEAAAPALQALVQRRVLRYAEQTARYEVAHDTLAKQLHARRSDEEIALLEVQRLIRSQVAIKAEAREYFSAKQLAFIEEVLPKLRLTAEEKGWVEESRKHREEEAAAAAQRKAEELARTKRRLRVVRGLLALALVALVAAGYFAWWASQQEQKAIAQTQVAEKALKERIDIEVAKYLTAAKRMKDMEDFDLARSILVEARELDSLNLEVNELLEELK
jgi:AAA+ ATPase superfamily predicted ATPase